MELALIHGIIADRAVAAIAQHRLQEADLERFREPQRVRVAIEDNSTKPCARVDRRQMQRYATERGHRVGRFPHSGERLGDAFRRFDDVGCHSAWGLNADRHRKSLNELESVGSTFGADSQPHLKWSIERGDIVRG